MLATFTSRGVQKFAKIKKGCRSEVFVISSGVRTRSRVLHVITDLTTGGAERALFNLLQGGLADLFGSMVISLRSEGTVGAKIAALNVPVTVLQMRGGLTSLTGFRKLFREVRLFQPDVIQGWMYHGNMAANIAVALAPGNPALIWNIRQTLYGLVAEKPMTRHVIRANRLFSRRPAVILYNSELSRKQHEAFGVDGRCAKVIPNGFDVDRMRPSENSVRATRAALAIPTSSRVVGHVARFHAMKNHEGFLRAAVRIGTELTDVHFVLLGRDVTSGNAALSKLVPDAMRGRFHWLGDRNDVPDIMCSMDLLCQSSSWGEGFPNVLGEAMTLEVPCVATDVGDAAAIIGGTGRIVAPGDDMALAVALREMLEKPTSTRAVLGAAARARIVEKYSLKSIVQQYAAVYDSLARKTESAN